MKHAKGVVGEESGLARFVDGRRKERLWGGGAYIG